MKDKSLKCIFEDMKECFNEFDDYTKTLITKL